MDGETPRDVENPPGSIGRLPQHYEGEKTMTRLIHQPDPRLDLVLERIIDVPQELVWAAWTTPEHLKHWFTPVPWKTVDCEIDLRPGGIFRTVMRSPEGQEFPNLGCYLEIIKKEPSTPRSSSTRTKRVENSMKKWDSTKAGAKPSISLLHV